MKIKQDKYILIQFVLHNKETLCKKFGLIRYIFSIVIYITFYV